MSEEPTRIHGHVVEREIVEHDEDPAGNNVHLTVQVSAKFVDGDVLTSDGCVLEFNG